MSEQQKMDQERAAFEAFWHDESSAELRKSCARGWAQYIWKARASLPLGVPDVSGIGRDADHPRAVVLYLRSEPTDDDIRAIQEALRAPAAQPAAEQSAPGEVVQLGSDAWMALHLLDRLNVDADDDMRVQQVEEIIRRMNAQLAARDAGEVLVPSLDGLCGVNHQLGMVALHSKSTEQTQAAVKELRAPLAQRERGGEV